MDKKKQTLATVLGRRLAEVRLEAGLPQKALAEVAGLTVGMVSMTERGVRSPTTLVQLIWANACGTTLAAVYEGLEEELEEVAAKGKRKGGR